LSIVKLHKLLRMDMCRFERACVASGFLDGLLPFHLHRHPIGVKWVDRFTSLPHVCGVPLFCSPLLLTYIVYHIFWKKSNRLLYFMAIYRQKLRQKLCDICTKFSTIPDPFCAIC
jgi:hypothetical protein